MGTQYIEKQVAIDSLGEEPEVWSTDNEWDMGAQEQWRFDHAAIVAVPPADVRTVVRSEWVLNDNGTWSCKWCHSWIPDEQRYYANYCLFCGADMSGGDKYDIARGN